jgi:predicted patatin/cPLA2 family phospholipase
VFNNKVVVAKFYDGTTEKAICDDEDSFSVETGLGICLLKHILGGSGAYNRLIQKTIRRHNKELEAEEKVKKEAEAKKLAEQKRKAKRAEKRKEKQIEMYKEALVRARKEAES